MANHASAKKRARQNEVKRLHNKSIISNVRGIIKGFSVSLADSTLEAGKLSEAFSTVQSTLQKAASKGLIPKNTVARKVSRLSSSMKKVLEARSK